MAPDNPNNQNRLDFAQSEPTVPSDAPELLSDYLDILWIHKWKFLVVLFVFLVFGFAYTLTRKKIYSADALVVVTAKPEGGGSSLTGVSDPLSRLEAVTQVPSIETQVAIIESDAITDEAFAQMPLSDRYRGFGRPDSSSPGDSSIFTAPPAWAVHVEPGKDDEIITISASSYAPDVAAKLANLVATTYLQEDRKVAGGATHQAEEFVKAQLSLTEKQFKEASDELANFESRSGFVSSDNQIKDLTDSIASTQTALNASSADLAEARQDLAVESRNIAATNSAVNGRDVNGPNPVRQQAEQNLSTLQDQLAQARQEYAEGSNTVHALKEKIAAEGRYVDSLKATINLSLETQRNPTKDFLSERVDDDAAKIAGFQGKLNAENAALRKSLASLREAPNQKRDSLILQQKLTDLQASYTKLSGTYHDLLVDESSVFAIRIYFGTGSAPFASC